MEPARLERNVHVRAGHRGRSFGHGARRPRAADPHSFRGRRRSPRPTQHTRENSQRRLPFPFLPRQLSLVGGLSIGIPGFLLALERNAQRAQAGFVRRVLGIALPAGIIAAATFAAYANARNDHATLAEARTTATVVLFVVVYWLLALVARPGSPARLTVLAFLTTLFLAALFVPASRQYFEFNAPPLATWLTSGALALAACGLLAVSLARSRALPRCA